MTNIQIGRHFSFTRCAASNPDGNSAEKVARPTQMPELIRKLNKESIEIAVSAPTPPAITNAVAHPKFQGPRCPTPIARAYTNWSANAISETAVKAASTPLMSAFMVSETESSILRKATRFMVLAKNAEKTYAIGSSQALLSLS
jgi:hypothetical protein